MEFPLEKFEQFLSNLTYNEYMAIGIALLLILLIVHSYSLVQGKKKLRQIVNDNVKVFQKAFDIAEDGMLILSGNNEVIYANKTMINLFAIKGNFLNKALGTIPKVKLKRTWMKFDEFLEEYSEKSKSKALFFSHASLQIDEHDEIPMHITVDSLSMGTDHKECYKVISIQDLRKIQDRESKEFKHRLTALPNQLQAIQDLPKLYSQIHIENKKIALVLLNIDNFSYLRSVIGYNQSNAVLIKFAQYLETLATNLNISVYHTFENHFLLTVSKLDSLEEIRKFVEDIQKQVAAF